MLRTVGAVIAGYIAIVFFTILGFSLFYVATGASFAYEPGTTVASSGWMTGALILSLLAAVFGGWVAAQFGRSFRAAIGLAGLVFVLGMVNAVMTRGITKELPAGRTVESLSVMEAAQYTTQPAWYNFVIPFIGVAGVLAGGGLATRKRLHPVPSVA